MNQQPEYTPLDQALPPINYQRARRRIAVPAFAIAFVFLFTALIQGILVSLVAAFCPQIMDYDWYIWVMSMVPLYAVAMPLSLLFYKLEPVQQKPETKSLPFPLLLGLLALCFALTYLGNFLGQLVNNIIGSITGNQPVNELQELTMSSPLWTNLLFCGILAPIMEEIFYRKVVIDRLRTLGELPTVLISGVVFGLIHGNFNQFFYAAFIGILFGYIYIYTGKLRYTIALHMCFNMVGGVYSTEMIKRMDLERLATDPYPEMIQNFGAYAMMLAYYVFIFAAIVGAIITVIYLVHLRPRLQKTERPLRPSEWARVGLLNPGVWMLAIVIVMLFL